MVSIFLFLSQNSTEKWSYTFLQLSKATEDFHLEIKEAEFHCGIFQFCFLRCYCLSKGVSYIIAWMILAQLCARIYYSDERDSYWDWVPELWPVHLSTPWMLLRDILHVVGKEQRHPLVCRLRMEEMFSKAACYYYCKKGKWFGIAVVTDNYCKSVAIDSVDREVNWSWGKGAGGCFAVTRL